MVIALAIVIGALGVVATYLFIGPAGAYNPQIWVAFIAWAGFFGAGGTKDAFVKSLAANLWDAVWATIAPLVVGGTVIRLDRQICTGSDGMVRACF